ncbi:DUF547 domain-containing protein [Halobiforma lacisalsi AJ5]|uniref:DUF547 domain-containing protein n=1 Tax=Natronobacterium lacisalsi AJ5 TaxID=358396 RepID=M0LJS9_NATLA|nr:DUF547 domain-containing protein [Halobiforma lacisalsi]APW98774.1 DUF547 domain-containing protein [Halobiforma lacisalsi AJ5]EMA32265.1 hypothetical protein C445_11047 [Halobiforma lacisalsi AJ5]
MADPFDGRDDEVGEASTGGRPPSTDPTTLARDLLERVRRGESADGHLRALADLSRADLEPLRNDPRAALAFWLNAYNAAAQLLLERNPELFDSRWRFFRAEALAVAGVGLSLDDVEHGILRGARSKYGLGYLPRLSRSGLPKAYRLEPDPRIHFALNCGAASCPLIRPYDPETVDAALDRATRTHLETTVDYDPERDRVRVPRYCLWFLGDFGGRSGLYEFLREFDRLPEGARPSLRFRDYDWTKTPRMFA